MKLVGGFLLLAGTVILFAALELLGQSVVRSGFMMAGLAVELLGLGLMFYAHRTEVRGKK
jgi:hypothetical protein